MNRIGKTLRGMLALLAVSGLALGQSQTVSFRQGQSGYAGTQDTFLDQAASTANNGAQPTLDIVNGTQKQGLLRFDGIIGTGTGLIPPGAQIESATLTINVWTAGSGVRVHKMMGAWTEASTWTSMTGGLQVGDDEAWWTAEDTKLNLPKALATFNVIRAVQDWANGEPNHGFALMPVESGTTATRLDSSESTFTTELPKLAVTFLPPDPSNPGPPTVTALNPPDGATNIGSGGRVALDVGLSDPDGDPLTVTFYGREKSGGGGGAGPDFTIVQIPDTQFYSENKTSGSIESFKNMTTWMVSQRNPLNIQFVAHMGDMVENNDDFEQEFINASGAMGIIENATTTGLPYGMPWGGAPGNHDKNKSGGANQYWEKYFGASRWSGRTYFKGGYSDNTTSASYQFFSASGMDFIVINMHYRPSATMIAWADALLKANPTRRGIITSHEILQAYLDAGTPVDQVPYYGQGKAMYDGLKNNPNLFLMLCGHWHGEGRRTEVYNGRKIHSIICNYQTDANGGDTWLRYLVFSPANGTITSNVIRTRDGSRRTANESQFTLQTDFGSVGAMADWTPLGTVSAPAGAPTATLDWTGLTSGKEYEWYAAASDGKSSVSTAPRTFTPGNNAAPTVSLTSPANGAVIERPATVNFAATASDTDGTVVRVEFYQGTVKVGEDTTAPYTYTWDAPAGSYSVSAAAVDNAGARTASASRTITVTGTGGPTPQPPTIQLMTPPDNATGVGNAGTVNLEASVSDPNNDALTVTFHGRMKPGTTPPPTGGNFTLVAIPDTQFYSESDSLMSHFKSMTQWMVTQRQALNVVFVSHMGDMTQNNAAAEYARTETAMRLIEDPVTTGLTHGIPWGGMQGNHDGSLWNNYYGPSRFAGRTYYKGGYPSGTGDNNYQFFSAGGMDFVVINMKYSPSSSTLSWADGIMKANPTRRAIVTSHSILNVGGSQTSWTPEGTTIFNALKNNPNLFLMLCGHMHGVGRRTDVVNGNTIYSVLQDWQEETGGGDSWLRYFTFEPATSKIKAYTIRTRDGSRRTDSNNQFELTYNMSGSLGIEATTDWTVLGTVSVPAGAQRATLAWSGLTIGTEHEWYAAVSDGSTPVGSVTRTFTPGANVPPTASLTAPANGAVITLPATVNFAVTAADSDGSVTKVEFYANGAKVGEDATSPYTFNWSAPVGSHTLFAVAQDSKGERTASASRTVTVQAGSANNPPTVALTAPANGGVILLPNAVSVAATAADSDGTVAKVEFYQGATKLGEDTSAPYAFTWQAPAGNYTLTAVAQDNASARTTSAPVAISVVLASDTPPTVALTSPASGATVPPGQTVALAATASDDNEVVGVSFHVDGTLVGNDATAPYTATWTAANPGGHTLTAMATDDMGQTSVSAPVTITVVAPPAPPTVALTAPANGAFIVLPNPIVFAATASDSDGSVAKVEFYLGATRVGVDNSAPYTFSWLAAAGTHTLTAVAQDNTGARATSSPATVTVLSSLPTVTLSGLVAPVPEGNARRGAIAHPLQGFKLTVANGPVTLDAVTIRTGGTHDGNDLANLKLWYSPDAGLGGDTRVGTLSNPGTAGAKVFAGLSLNLPVGVHHVFVTADIAAAATAPNGVNVGPVAAGDLSLALGATSGGPTPTGGMQTILQPMTPGNVAAVLVDGNGAALAADAAMVRVNEYTPHGALVNSLVMPAGAYGTRLTVTGTTELEGGLGISPNGRYLALAGYDAAADETIWASVAPRTIARIDAADATVDLSTTGLLGGNDATRHALPNNAGTGFWLSQLFSGDQRATSGLSFLSLGRTAPGSYLYPHNNLRATRIFDGQLYGFADNSNDVAGVNFGIYQIGAGLPTNGMQTVTGLPGLSGDPDLDCAGFYMADLSGAEAGYDTLWMARWARGVSKYAKIGGIWTLVNTMEGFNARSLDVDLDGAVAEVFIVEGAVEGASRLMKLTDAGGYGAPLQGAFAPIAQDGPNRIFRSLVVLRELPLPGPDVDIKVNGQDGPVTLRSSAALVATIHLTTGAHAGRNADWWAMAHDVARNTWYLYVAPYGPTSWKVWDAGVTDQGPLFDLPAHEALITSGLGVGPYHLYFGVDMNPNGILDFDALYYDSVDVEIVP